MVKAKTGKVGRKRRAAGWVLSTLGVLVAGVWVWSGGYGLSWRPGDWKILASRGVLTASWWKSDPESKKSTASSPYASWNWEWMLDPTPKAQPFYSSSGWDLWIASHYESWLTGEPLYVTKRWALVLWPVPPLLWAPGGLFLRSGILARRRAITGMCKACGYNLAGLGAAGAGVTCPECGKVA